MEAAIIIKDKLTKVRNIYESFNKEYYGLIDLNRVDEALSKVIIVNDNYEGIEKEAKRVFDSGALAVSGNGKIYVKSNVSLDVLFHEILHFISEEHKGLQLPFMQAMSDEDVMENAKKYGPNRFLRQVEQLDESMTRFLTELALPEVEIKDAYRYGASVIRSYYSTLLSKDKNPEYLFRMYINGAVEDMERFQRSFGHNLSRVLDSIEQNNNMRLYLIKIPEIRPLKDSEMSSIIEEATSNVKKI